jgi:hypothetical protein
MVEAIRDQLVIGLAIAAAIELLVWFVWTRRRPSP